MIKLVAYCLFGVIHSYHIGNSVTIDSMGGTRVGGIYPLEAMAASQGYPLESALHGDPQQGLSEIWQEPEGHVGDPPRLQWYDNPYGAWPNALLNYTWDHVVIAPYPGSTLGVDRQMVENFIDYARQNPGNNNTTYYVFQMWPYKNFVPDFETYWNTPYAGLDDSPVVRRKGFYMALMEDLEEKYDPLDIKVRMIPVGEVFLRLSETLPLSYLYRDNVHASLEIGRYVAAATMLATMMQENIDDLVPPEEFLTVDPALVALINPIIWDVVSTEWRTGIPRMLGDFNTDGVTDAADLAIWQEGYGTQFSGKDLVNWQRNYNGDSSQLLSVPEPSTLIMLSLGFLTLARRRG